MKVAKVIFFVFVIGNFGCTEPGESTKMGAATGGVIGAGLGAIVGNQVGNTGSGLVIGAASGAAAGAAIGNAFDAQDKRLAAQEENITRREQSLNAQRSEISELRHMNGDNGQTLSSYQQGSTAGGYNRGFGGGGEARYASPSEIQSARARMNPSMAPRFQPERAPSFQPQYPQAIEQPRPVEEIIEKSRPEPMKNTRSSNPPSAVLPARSNSTVRERSLIVEQPSRKQEEMNRDKIPQQDNVDASTVSSLQPAEETSDCSTAVNEIRKADAASETADKLFHVRRAIRLCPTEAKFHKDLSEVYKKMGREEDSKFEVQEAARLDAASGPNDQAVQGGRRHSDDTVQSLLTEVYVSFHDACPFNFFLRKPDSSSRV